MKEFTLEYHKISQRQDIDSAMVIFHGYGDSKEGFIDFAQFLSRRFPKMGFFLVNAPDTLMFGGYSWFPLEQADFAAFDNPDLALKTLNNLIARAPLDKAHSFTQEIAQKEELAYERVIYTGFSQGGFMALAGGLTFPEKLGGVIAMSAVPLTFGLDFSLDKVKQTPDTLLTHGTGDTIVPFACLEITKTNLHNVGTIVDEIVLANTEHNESITIEVLDKITSFLQERGF